MKSDYNEKKEARADRYRALSSKADQASTSAWKQSHEMVSCIPMGQPILVGHHSEAGHRRLLDKSWNKMGQSVALSKKADYYANKAEAAENNTAISQDNPDAIQLIEAKIEGLQNMQNLMKSANKILKSTKMPEVQKIEEFAKIGLSESKYFSLKEPDFCGRIGFADYQTTNNNANINRLKKRLIELQKSAERETKEVEINGINVIENADENRLQIFFPGKPSDEVRTELKRSGFRWSPSNGCWQAYLNNRSIYNAKQIIESMPVE